MNVASLENSKKLYELSKWTETEYVHSSDTYRAGYDLMLRERANGLVLPAYDAGYLLRKLQHLNVDLYPIDKGSCWYACVQWEENSTELPADTPEDALAKLAIELFKQGVLTNDSKTSN